MLQHCAAHPKSFTYLLYAKSNPNKVKVSLVVEKTVPYHETILELET